MQLLWLLLLLTLLYIGEEAFGKDEDVKYHPEKGLHTLGEFFVETFQSETHLFDGKPVWIQSSHERYSGQEWAHGSSQGGREPGIPGDKSLVIAKPHKHYGISRVLDQVFDNKNNKDLVIQYEVRFHAGIGCSGAYLKLIAQPENGASFDARSLNEQTGYSIMFGPDKCGTTNKVHMIIRKKNPKTQKWEEHHLSKNIPAEIDGISHLYTLEIKHDDTFRILIDLSEKITGSLKDEMLFNPPFGNVKEIDDPNDKKPADWHDNPKIVDETARKPDDWDENAPKEILDPKASKPSGWLDDAPLQIPDPNAKKPLDWIDEDDGEWSPPLVPNPACKSVGCGVWVHPKIPNPAFKGKWSPPMIANPNYIGPWAPRKIPNPDHYDDDHPHEVAPIAAIAIEVLANERGIAFDNIIISNDLESTKLFALRTFTPKQQLEISQDKAFAKEKAEKERLAMYESGGYGVVQYYALTAYEIFQDNQVVVGVSLLITLISLVYICCFTEMVFENRAPLNRVYTPVIEMKDEDLDMKIPTQSSASAVEDNKVNEEDDDEDDDGEGAATVKASPRKPPHAN